MNERALIQNWLLLSSFISHLLLLLLLTLLTLIPVSCHTFVLHPSRLDFSLGRCLNALLLRH